MNFEPIIGLEIHVQLKTLSKVFCGCNADTWESKPNTHTCPVCLGLPGALPVLNQEALEKAITVGLALNCSIAKETYFERKNYFYPDLPKGYQISQYRAPLAVGGEVKIKEQREKRKDTDQNSKSKNIRINRVHLEEDTAKSMHTKDGTLLDFNKSGIPLLEIVSEPDLTSAEEAKEYGKKIQQLVRYLGVSDADMEKGQMRLEANISLRERKAKSVKRKADMKLPNYRVEVKNINSFRFLEKAINYEIDRQTKVLEAGETLTQETRGFDTRTGETFVQRTKEEAHDYRYFPEPDLPPIEIKSVRVNELKRNLPELPDEKVERFIEKHGIPENYAELLVESREKSDYFEATVKFGAGPKEAARILVNRPEELTGVSPEKAAEKIRSAKTEIVTDKVALGEIVQKVIASNPQAVADFKKGKQVAIQFLLGQVMRENVGKADPRVVVEIIRKQL